MEVIALLLFAAVWLRHCLAEGQALRTRDMGARR